MSAARPTFQEPFPIFTVQDLPSTVDFYRAGFGFESRYRYPADAAMEDIEFIVLDLGGHSIALGRHPAEAPLSDDVLSGVQLCLKVDDIHAAWEWLLSHGATAIEVPKQERWDEWSAFVADPAGLRVMIYAPI